LKVGDLVRGGENIGIIVEVRNDLPVVLVLWNRDQPFWDEDPRKQWFYQHAVELISES
jgi:hypothetical protein